MKIYELQGKNLMVGLVIVSFLLYSTSALTEEPLEEVSEKKRK